MSSDQLHLFSNSDERHVFISRVFDVGTITLGVLIGLSTIALATTGDRNLLQAGIVFAIGTSVAALGINEFRHCTEQNRLFDLQHINGQQGSDTV